MTTTIMARLLAKAPVYARDAVARPGWLPMFVFGRFPALRRAYMRRWRRRDHAVVARAAPCEALSSHSRGEIVDMLRKDGLAPVLTLPHDVTHEIVDFAERAPCYAYMDRAMPFRVDAHGEAEKRYGGPILVGHFLDGIRQCAAARELAGNRWLRQIAADYLGGAATMTASRMWWSFPGRDARPDQLSTASQGGFYYDLDDWRQVKFVFYLTDVDDRNGQHIYVRGSHRRRPLAVQFSPFVGVSRRLVSRFYDRAAIIAVRGRRGSGFAEDPFGLHMGAVLKAGRRLVLELSFGTSQLIPRRRYGELVPA